jgi:hypothetical protein
VPKSEQKTHSFCHIFEAIIDLFVRYKLSFTVNFLSQFGHPKNVPFRSVHFLLFWKCLSLCTFFKIAPAKFMAYCILVHKKNAKCVIFNFIDCSFEYTFYQIFKKEQKINTTFCKHGNFLCLRSSRVYFYVTHKTAFIPDKFNVVLNKKTSL